MTVDPKPANRPKRRWFQFSLRTLLIFMTVAGCGLGWLGVKVKTAQRQNAAVKQILILGGEVNYDYEYDKEDVLIEKTVIPHRTWLNDLLGDDFFRDVYGLRLSGQHISDVELELLGGMDKLRYFTDGTFVSDKGVEHLAGLKDLRWLDLSGTCVTYAGLEKLKDLSHLNALSLSERQINEAEAEKLKQLMPHCKVYR